MGGNSAVIDEFIKFTHVDSFRRYEMIDFSSGEAKTITRRSDEIKNHKKECLFPTEIYCKVSHNTFSSARTFAVTLKDNGIAKIIGTETGGKPNSYGMPNYSNNRLRTICKKGLLWITTSCSCYSNRLSCRC
jgi:hypothetical protein